MALFVQNISQDGKHFTHSFGQNNPAEVAQAVHGKLLSDGYKLKDGQAGNGNYEKGNRILRILFGAFVKYFKVLVSTDVDGEQNTLVSMKKETSGMSGGLIGMGQVKKEFKRLANEMQQI